MRACLCVCVNLLINYTDMLANAWKVQSQIKLNRTRSERKREMPCCRNHKTQILNYKWIWKMKNKFSRSTIGELSTINQKEIIYVSNFFFISLLNIIIHLFDVLYCYFFLVSYAFVLKIGRHHRRRRRSHRCFVSHFKIAACRQCSDDQSQCRDSICPNRILLVANALSVSFSKP